MDGTVHRAETNKDKSHALATALLPPKPATSQVPSSHNYPMSITYQFQLHEAQLQHHISKLKPHKTPGDDGRLLRTDPHRNLMQNWNIAGASKGDANIPWFWP